MTTDKSMFAYFKEGTAHLPRTNRTVSFYGRELTLGEVMAEIDGFAARLTEIGVGKGDNVIICLGNIPDAVIAFYAVNKIGAIANLVHPLVTASRLVQIARTMHSKAAVLFDEFYGGYDGWEELGVKTFIASAADYLPRVLAPFYRLAKKRTTSPSRGQESFLSAVKRGMGLQGGAAEAEIGGEDIAIYMHSGGTTGTPKSVELSNRAFNALAHNLLALIGGKPVDDRDAMLMVLPLFHNFGLGVCMHTSLSAGGKIVLMPKFDGRAACKLCRRAGVTFICGVPNMYGKMLDSGAFGEDIMRRLKYCYCGGDRLSDSIRRKFDNLAARVGNPIKLYEGYGLTEAGICCVNMCGRERLGSIGKPVENTFFEAFGDDGAPVPRGREGELCISTDMAMTRYYNDPETTAKVFFEYGGKRWIRTGDIGRLDEDGFVYFVDRKKRMIKISGHNVFPQEIENVVNKASGVKRCCAVADEYDGKAAVKLYVQPEEGADEAAVERTVRDEIGAKLVKYNMPRRIIFVQKLPLTQIGKVDYRKLEENR
ncbi:MAG TPA: acyl--CoA ligase [Candidatus Ornithoclostridium faecigallinarum]|nr:acyl--CoA ligase [Candidatus Ornithoclostridium faecigallinarum]